MPYIFNGAAAVTGTDTTGLLNPVDYGASTGASGSENAAAFNSCITAAASVGKGIFIPAGTFVSNKITYDPFVSIRGVSWKNSILKSNAPETLLSYAGTAYKNMVDIRDIQLAGNNVGTTGLELQSSSGVSIKDVYINRFAGKGIDMRGVLVGKFTSCYIHYNQTGVYSDVDPDSALGANLGGNHIIFDMCVANGNTQWAVSWKDGGNVKFLGCDFEANGTASNAATGVIKMETTSLSHMIGQEIALVDCWLERNLGTIIQLPVPGGRYVTRHKSVLERTQIQYNGSDNNGTGLVNVVRMLGTTGTHELTIRDSNITKNGTAAVVGDGAGAIVRSLYSDIEYHTELNGATYTAL
jgi:hypothetical protein